MNTVIPLNMSSAATMLSALIALAVLLLTIFLIFRPRSHASAIKLLGSLMVLALAFGSNTGVVYALAIFIVATLVTELDFLEKLAAIFWNREKYWEYRLKNASPSEVAAKQEAEAQKEIATEEPTEEAGDSPGKSTKPKTPTDRSQAVQMAMDFEQAVLNALAAGRGPFAPVHINSRVKVIPSHGKPQIYDAIVEGPGIHYVIEVKYGKRPSTLIDAMAQLERSVPIYRNYLLERGITAQIIPIAIVPSDINGPDLFRDWLAVLKFDFESHRFTNENEFTKTVRLNWHIV
jgi:hypothetical protein